MELTIKTSIPEAMMTRQAAQIAIDTVRTHREQGHGKMKVIFNVFKEKDRQLYEQLL